MRVFLTLIAMGYFFCCYQIWTSDRTLHQAVNRQNEEVEALQYRLNEFRRNVEVLDQVMKK